MTGTSPPNGGEPSGSTDLIDPGAPAGLGAAWRAGRPPAALIHLDSAAAARSSSAVMAAVQAHLLLEATVGGYVAAGRAQDRVEQGRAALAGLLGRAADDLAFTESAYASLAALLDAWPLAPGSRVVVTSGEYGPNVSLFRARGLVVDPASVSDTVGHLDVAALATSLAVDPPALVHLCAVGAHRGVAQPFAAAVEACRAAGVPVVLDLAQALGPLDCRTDADAVYGTSRKWLAGPRGVGFLAVAPRLAERLQPRTTTGGPPARDLESREAFVAGRVGLAVAVAEHLAVGPERIRARLAEVGATVRRRMDGVGGWTVVEPVDEPTAITTLRPPPGWDDQAVAAAVRRLLDQDGIVVTFAGPVRAPLEVDRATLRVSPHVDVLDREVDALAAALERGARA